MDHITQSNSASSTGSAQFNADVNIGSSTPTRANLEVIRQVHIALSSNGI